MTEKQKQIWDVLCKLDGEMVARLFTDYHGNQLLNDGFREYLQDEGYLKPDDEPECCKDCDACPINIWLTCPNAGDYSEEEEE